LDGGSASWKTVRTCFSGNRKIRPIGMSPL
jgi:hypothetical protein